MPPTQQRFFLASSLRRYLMVVNTYQDAVESRRRGDESSAPETLSPEAIRVDLIAHLEKQGKELESWIQQASPGLHGELEKSRSRLPQAQYLMAEVTDRRFGLLDWWGRDAWVHEPMVNAFPPPDGLADSILEQVEALWQELSADREEAVTSEAATQGPPQQESSPVSLDLLQVYLLILAVDFADLKAEDVERVLILRRLLADHVITHDAMLAAPREHLFPVAYQRASRSGPTGFLPRLGVWVVALVVVLAVYWAASSWLWWDASESVRRLAKSLVDLLEVSGW